MEFTSKFFEELTTKELYEILKVRAMIFVVEQQIRYVDMDDYDQNSLHCFLKDGDNIVAYLRAFVTDEKKRKVKIGRVLTIQHGNGIGRILMTESLAAIKEKLQADMVWVDAQTHAVGYYQKFGFSPCSEEFLEQGIPHIKMIGKEQ